MKKKRDKYIERKEIERDKESLKGNCMSRES